MPPSGGQDLLGRHAPAARSGRGSCGATTRACSSTSRPRASTPAAASACGRRSRVAWRPARPCCSPRSTSRRPTAWPTRIVVIDHGTVIAEGTSDELKDQIGGERLEVELDARRRRRGRDRRARGPRRRPAGRRRTSVLTAPVRAPRRRHPRGRPPARPRRRRDRRHRAAAADARRRVHRPHRPRGRGRDRGRGGASAHEHALADRCPTPGCSRAATCCASRASPTC